MFRNKWPLRQPDQSGASQHLRSSSFKLTPVPEERSLQIAELLFDVLGTLPHLPLKLPVVRRIEQRGLSATPGDQSLDQMDSHENEETACWEKHVEGQHDLLVIIAGPRKQVAHQEDATGTACRVCETLVSQALDDHAPPSQFSVISEWNGENGIAATRKERPRRCSAQVFHRRGRNANGNTVCSYSNSVLLRFLFLFSVAAPLPASSNVKYATALPLGTGFPSARVASKKEKCENKRAQLDQARRAPGGKVSLRTWLNAHKQYQQGFDGQLPVPFVLAFNAVRHSAKHIFAILPGKSWF